MERKNADLAQKNAALRAQLLSSSVAPKEMVRTVDERERERGREERREGERREEECDSTYIQSL